MARSKSSDTYHHGSLKDSLVDRAIEKLDEGLDPGALSIRALAAELGVSAGAPYRHFPVAEALIAAVAARGFAVVQDQMRAAAAGVSVGASDQTAARERLERMGIAYVEFAAGHPQWYQAMFTLPSGSLADYPDLATAAGEAFSLLEGAVTSFQASRANTRVHPGEAAIAALAYVHGLAGLVTGSLASFGDDPSVLQRLMTALTQGL
jgi:AcrR family transcriptional regulator